MPIYEFYCDICESSQEKLQKYEDPIPECCGKPMKRTAGGLAFWSWKGDRMGSTPGIRKHFQELNNKNR